ncbi:uncharacterized protein TrAtP1_011138 [Trichoderma atroviride]|uniref:uncharacterized protein n=1 Tax=Hypocrea atroviridis TaxID=63577 RepID=UPI003324E18B|nr:hypothetical protein TrAtP1_011138 [Trichoderma atroviride]
MARTKEDAKAANNASTDITHQATEDAGPYVPTGKPRGRPKGSGKKGAQARAKAAKKVLPPLAPGEKRRGRPRKSDVAQTQDDDDQAATAESEANVEAEAEDDAASNQPGIGDVASDARTGARSALTPQQSPEYEEDQVDYDNDDE